MKKIYMNLSIISIFFLCYILLFISKFNYNLSSTIELSELHVQRFVGTLPHGFVVQLNSDGYDGQFYYMMAVNPLFEQISTLPPHHSQRIIYPLLAFVSSFGKIHLIPFAMLFINYVSLILSNYILMLILEKYKTSLNLVFLWAFNVGFLICVIRDLTEPLMILFVITSIYFMEKQKYFISMVFLAIAILTKEVAFSLYIALLLYYLIKLDFHKLRLYSLAMIPFLIWEIILIIKTENIPLLNSFSHIAKPFVFVLEYIIAIPSYLYKYFISNFSFQNFLTLSYYKPLYRALSPLPIVLFALIQLVIILIIYFKDKKITMNVLLLLSQLAMILSLKRFFFFDLEIDCIGRFAIPMFLFSMIYYVEKKEKYDRLLKVLTVALFVLSIGMSIVYFLKKIMIDYVQYYIT